MKNYGDLGGCYPPRPTALIFIQISNIMGLRYGNYKRLLLCGHPILIYQQTFSACMFCFPISDHVMVLQRTVSFKYHLIHVAALVCLIYE